MTKEELIEIAEEYVEFMGEPNDFYIYKDMIEDKKQQNGETWEEFMEFAEEVSNYCECGRALQEGDCGMCAMCR